MIKKENIKTFVRETLGCECPENVFDYIDSQHSIELNSEILLSDKINIGNRLLIYTVDVNDVKFIENNLIELISIGRKERDMKGFNRFRLAIITDKMDEIRQIAHMTFKKSKDKDKKIHLHLINRNEMTI